MYALRYYKSTSKVQRLRNTLAAGGWRLAPAIIATTRHYTYSYTMYSNTTSTNG